MRVRSSVIATGCFLVVAAILSSQAEAQTHQQQIDWCNGKDGATLDLKIGGCTAVIQSGKLTVKNLAIAFGNRSLAFSEKKQFDRGLEDANQAIKIAPNSDIGFTNRGYAYALRKPQFDRADWSLAVKDWSESIRLAPNDSIPLNNRCEARAKLGQAQAALADCNMSLQISANYDDALKNRGFAYLRLGQIDRAISDYDSALKLSPKLAEALQANIAEEFARYGVK